MDYHTDQTLFKSFRECDNFIRNKPIDIYRKEVRENYLDLLDSKREKTFETIFTDLNTVVNNVRNFYIDNYKPLDSIFKHLLRDQLQQYGNELIINRWLTEFKVKIFTDYSFNNEGIVFYTQDKEEYIYITDNINLKSSFARLLLNQGLYKIIAVDFMNRNHNYMIRGSNKDFKTI